MQSLGPHLVPTESIRHWGGAHVFYQPPGDPAACSVLRTTTVWLVPVTQELVHAHTHTHIHTQTFPGFRGQLYTAYLVDIRIYIYTELKLLFEYLSDTMEL